MFFRRLKTMLLVGSISENVFEIGLLLSFLQALKVLGRAQWSRSSNWSLTSKQITQTIFVAFYSLNT